MTWAVSGSYSLLICVGSHLFPLPSLKWSYDQLYCIWVILLAVISEFIANFFNSILASGVLKPTFIMKFYVKSDFFSNKSILSLLVSFCQCFINGINITLYHHQDVCNVHTCQMIWSLWSKLCRTIWGMNHTFIILKLSVFF